MSEQHLVFGFCVDIDPAVEDDFNDWYSNEHVPAVVACPGIISGQRYRMQGVDEDGAGLASYWAFYEVESKAAMNSPEIQALAKEGFGRFTDRVSNMRRMWFTPVEVPAPLESSAS